MSAIKWIARQWCSWTHGGGKIKRYSMDRINWQCSKCGRWSDPVSHADEARQVAAALAGDGEASE